MPFILPISSFSSSVFVMSFVMLLSILLPLLILIPLLSEVFVIIFLCLASVDSFLLPQLLISVSSALSMASMLSKLPSILVFSFFCDILLWNSMIIFLSVIELSILTLKAFLEVFMMVLLPALASASASMTSLMLWSLLSLSYLLYFLKLSFNLFSFLSFFFTRATMLVGFAF